MIDLTISLLVSWIKFHGNIKRRMDDDSKHETNLNLGQSKCGFLMKAQFVYFQCLHDNQEVYNK